MPDSVAQLDACLTDDQEVACSVPTGSGNLLLWRLIVKYFLWSFSLFCKKDSELSVSSERMYTSTD